MIGENLKRMNDGLQKIVGDLRKDPHALETVWVSVIAFAGVARTIVPLHDIVSFIPRLPVGGGTNLATALRELTTQIDSQVRKRRRKKKVTGSQLSTYLLTVDRQMTFQLKLSAGTNFTQKLNMIAVGIGSSVDLQCTQATD